MIATQLHIFISPYTTLPISLLTSVEWISSHLPLIPSSYALNEELSKDLAALHPCTSVWKTLGRSFFLLEALWGASSRNDVCEVSGCV